MITARRIVFWVMAAQALMWCAAAFAWPAASSYWIDELFTLFVTDHAGGPAEVIRRALTDTHPPAYYLALNVWIGAFGSSETPVRLLSAVFAVGGVALFAASTGRALSWPARAFGAVMATSSPFWFMQSQNARSYPFCMLISAALMALALQARRQAADGRRVHLGLWAGLTTVGLIGAFTHFYMLLQVGMVFAVLLVSVPDNRFRLLLVLSGLSILGCDLAYIHALQAHTQLDFHNLWFSNDPGALQGAVKGFWKNGFSGSVKNAYVVLALGWIVLAWRRRVTAPVAPAQRPEADWLALMAVVVIIGVTLTGLAASLLFAPSFSDLNLQVALPWIWVLSAWLFDKVVRGGRRRDEVVVGLLTAVMLTGTLPAVVGRTLQRHEDYRGSAAYVAASPGCAGEEVPVIIPFRFGPSTPFFRRLAEQSFFGRYYQGGGRLRAWSPGELAFSADPELSSLFAARAQGRDACKVMAWGVHDIDQWRAEALARWIAKRADVAPAQVQVRIIPSWRRNGKSWAADGDGAFVFEVVRPKG